MKQLSLFDGQVELVLTEKAEGNMKVSPDLNQEELAQTRKNRSEALKAIDLNAQSTALLRVSYGQDDYCKFVAIESADDYGLDKDLSTNAQDGIVTSTPNLGILLPLADCLGLVLFDSNTKTLMVVHCGRHTLLQNGAQRAVAFMTEQAKIEPECLLAWFSPCAGKENYPLFDADNLSLQELTTRQLMNAGVLARNIVLSTADTTKSSDYFSHSQGDTTKRFAICAKISS